MGTFTVAILFCAAPVLSISCRSWGKASLAGKAKLCRVVLRGPDGAVNPFTLEDLGTPS